MHMHKMIKKDRIGPFSKKKVLFQGQRHKNLKVTTPKAELLVVWLGTLLEQKPNTRHLSPCVSLLWRSHSLQGLDWFSFFIDRWKAHSNTLSVLGLLPNQKGRVHSCCSPDADCLDKVLFVSKIISKKIDFNSCATLSWLQEKYSS